MIGALESSMKVKDFHGISMFQSSLVVFIELFQMKKEQ